MACGFTVQFTRYDPESCERRLGRREYINAENFSVAYERAMLIIRGMTSAYPNCDFAIVSLVTTDYHGVDCDAGVGVRMFETAEEYSERYYGAQGA